MCFVAHVKYAWSLVCVNRLVDDLKWLPFVYFSECVTFVYVWWYKNRFVCLTLTKCVHSNLHEMLNADTRRGRVREFKQGAYNIFKQIIYLTKCNFNNKLLNFQSPNFLSHSSHLLSFNSVWNGGCFCSFTLILIWINTHNTHPLQSNNKRMKLRWNSINAQVHFGLVSFVTWTWLII